ncbi:MAG: biotin--[acetyl-CoA-carboxylase] ligase [Acidobacteriota bacterium]|nr:MAG: biotin--[acetyl-CoA-carboxylase] ligase [Acidobacteriota bacterium]
MFGQMELLDSVESTNDYLKQFVEELEPRIVVAREQTAGKGRFGRVWNSPAGEGLYLSFLFYPDWKMANTEFLNVISSLSVAHAIRAVSDSAPVVAVKHPNDVYLNGKKVCGILTELGSQGDRITWAVIGIGVNVYQSQFPPDLDQKATSLKLEGIEISDILLLAEDIVTRLERLLESLRAGQWEKLEKEYRRSLL